MRHRMMPAQRRVPLSKEKPMSDVHVLAIDLAKRSFRVCGAGRGGAVHRRSGADRTC